MSGVFFLNCADAALMRHIQCFYLLTLRGSYHCNASLPCDAQLLPLSQDYHMDNSIQETERHAACTAVSRHTDTHRVVVN